MPWRVISSTDVRLTPQETAVLNAISGSGGICQDILTTVTGEFIGAIQAGGNQIANDGTIPDAVRQHVINRVRWLWLAEFPAMKAFKTDARKEGNDAAEKYLIKLATGHPKIEPPPNPVPGAAPLVTMPSTGEEKLHEFRKSREDGI